MCVCTKKMIFSVELINISTTFHDNHFLFSMCAHTKNPSHWPSCTAQLYSKLCVCMYVRACVCVLDIWSPELVLYNWDFVPLEDLSEPPSALNTALLFRWVRHCKFHLGMMAAGSVFLFRVLSEWEKAILSVTDRLCTTPCLSIHLSTKPPVSP